MRAVVNRISRDQKTLSKKVEGIGTTADHIEETTDRINPDASA